MKRKIYTFEELLSGWAGLGDELREQSDRGAVLVGAAYLDDTLGALLVEKFVDCSESRELLLEQSGLSSFGIRIKVAYCMGLIGKGVLHDLNIIRDIRNRFAHLSERLTLEPFDARLLELQCLKHPKIEIEENATAKDKFLGAVAMLILELHFRADRAKHMRSAPDFKFFDSLDDIAFSISSDDSGTTIEFLPDKDVES